MQADSQEEVTSKGTLGSVVVRHMYDRLAELGVFDKPPLVPLVDWESQQKAAAEGAKRASEPPLVKPAKKSEDERPHIVQAEAEAQRSMMMEEALSNQQYYLRKAAETGKPWHHHPKRALQYSEFVMISHDMAEVLEQYNTHNRPKSPRTIDSYARDMVADNWLQTEESIAIDVFGNFYNGQHRTGAILQTGKAMPLYVTFQGSEKAIFAVDSGRPRPVNQKLGMLFGVGRLKGNKIPAVCKAMMSGASPRTRRFTESELADFMAKHEEIVDWVYHTMPRGTRADVSAAFAKAALWYGKDVIEPLAKRFHDIDFHGDADPCKTLYRWIQRSKATKGVPGITVYRKVMYGIECHVINKPCYKLQEKETDVFEWEDGWVVPQHVD